MPYKMLALNMVADSVTDILDKEELEGWTVISIVGDPQPGYVINVFLHKPRRGEAPMSFPLFRIEEARKAAETLNKAKSEDMPDV